MTVTTIAIRRSGGAKIVSLPKTVVEMMHLDVGSTLDLRVEGDSIILTRHKPEKTLEELLEGYSSEDFAMDEEDREWHDMKPTDKETL